MKHLIVFFIIVLVLVPCAIAQEQAAEKKLEVAEAKLGKSVENRVLTDETSTFTVNDRAYLWLRVTGGPADSITVTWKTGDQSYESRLNIGGSPWRTWSYKTCYVAGSWTVTVTDAQGTTLKELSFTVEEAKLEMKQ
ncbi:MAG: DUF2914 domain-containing protein [Bacteroidota bacterium]